MRLFAENKDIELCQKTQISLEENFKTSILDVDMQLVPTRQGSAMSEGWAVWSNAPVQMLQRYSNPRLLLPEDLCHLQLVPATPLSISPKRFHSLHHHCSAI
jgi:hypothetical protein